MSVIRLSPGWAWVNVDALPEDDDVHLLSLTSRQLRIARSFLFPHARMPNRLLRVLGPDLAETISGADLSAYIDDLDEIEDALGGVPMILEYATAAELEGVASAENAGDSPTVTRGDHVHAIAQDVAKVTSLVDSNGVARLAVGTSKQLYFTELSAFVMQAHLTNEIAAGGTVVQLFDNVYANGLLFVATNVSSISAQFALNRGSCVVLGTPGANITNVKDTASKLNIYHDSDNYVKAQNNYSTALRLRMMWVSAGGSVLLNAAL